MIENSSKKKSKFSTIVIVIIIICCIGLIGKACGLSSSHKSYSSSLSYKSSGEVRCWYCSKVIYNDGRAIHCSHKYQNSYVCDYCGTTNVIK